MRQGATRYERAQNYVRSGRTAAAALQTSCALDRSSTCPASVMTGRAHVRRRGAGRLSCDARGVLRPEPYQSRLTAIGKLGGKPSFPDSASDDALGADSGHPRGRDQTAGFDP